MKFMDYEISAEEFNYMVENFKNNPYFYENDEVCFGTFDDVPITVGYMKSLIRDQKIEQILNGKK